MLLSGKSLKHDFIRFVSATMASQVVFSLYSMVDGLVRPSLVYRWDGNRFVRQK